MLTYQNLMKVGESDEAKAKFCADAVAAFKQTADYHLAKAGDAYYNKHNLTIENFQKYLYTISGRQVPDVFSSNYKLKTTFFRRLVLQQVQYVLGNGVVFENPKTKEKLGKDFDFKVQLAAKMAMSGGKAFGFWNLDHLEVFGYADTEVEPGFCPIYDEKTAELKAGIRYWSRKVDNVEVTRYTLYEADGYTEYISSKKENPTVLQAKKAYKVKRTMTAAGGVEAEVGENYTSLPIVPLFVNDSHESELVGLRESIDCYDYIKSGLANDIDDTAGFYWLLKNTGGMDDTDLARFIQRMKTVHASYVDGDDGASAEAHTLEVPVAARSYMIELLRKDIYEDFQALDVTTLSAAAKTTQEIQAAYQSQDNKCADFEYYLIDFVQGILELAQIDDNPTFNWMRVINQAEQTNMILAAANYLPDDIVIKHLPFLTPEEAELAIKLNAEDNYKQFTQTPQEQPNNEDVEDENEDK